MSYVKPGQFISIFWVPPGRGKRGRPRITWIDGALSCMREKGLEEGDWSDREWWRKMTAD